MTPDVESARREWEDAHRRLDEALHDPVRSPALEAQLDVLGRELRKRVGGRFTLGELVAEYHRAERWARDVVGEHAPAPGWPRTLTLIVGAAFHAVSLGALDYEP